MCTKNNRCNFTSCRFNAEGICENEEAREECVDISRKALCLDEDKSCEKCEYADLDYIYDEIEHEEYPLYVCQKGNNVSRDFECKDFKQIEPKPHKEKFTKCDKCENKNDCMEKGNLNDITGVEDRIKHFINKFGYECEL